ncbi:LysR family transcriptional regulator [Pseudothauera nasutitermitis]|uniref:LysR family transcriptional regulator n=2 Tax=Pseudothauera nasutitermitis TaxID=2565930 RepID=A0A4S4B0I4_9RHOO|nr:LysR family transcriptional regulator [Pseudothauera nasutitermitis]
MHSAPRPSLRGRVLLETDLGALLDDTRIRLLEAIDTAGSLSAAARITPLSYKAAWDALEAMNHAAGSPLTVRITGGRRGGGTALTAHGRCLMALYRAVEWECQAAVGELVRHLECGGDACNFGNLLHRPPPGRATAGQPGAAPALAGKGEC